MHDMKCKRCGKGFQVKEYGEIRRKYCGEDECQRIVYHCHVSGMGVEEKASSSIYGKYCMPDSILYNVIHKW